MRFNNALFAAAIRQKRAADDVNLYHVALFTDISVSTISRIESGKITNFNLETYAALCDWLQVDLGAFFSTTTEAAPVVATIEMIETLLRAEGSPFCKAVAEVIRISREREGD